MNSITLFYTYLCQCVHLMLTLDYLPLHCIFLSFHLDIQL